MTRFRQSILCELLSFEVLVAIASVNLQTGISVTSLLLILMRGVAFSLYLGNGGMSLALDALELDLPSKRQGR